MDRLEKEIDSGMKLSADEQAVVKAELNVTRGHGDDSQATGAAISRWSITRSGMWTSTLSSKWTSR